MKEVSEEFCRKVGEKLVQLVLEQYPKELPRRNFLVNEIIQEFRTQVIINYSQDKSSQEFIGFDPKEKHFFTNDQ